MATATPEQIRDATYDAILAITQGNASSYQLTIGDDVKMVTKLDLPKLQAQLDWAKQVISTATVGNRRNFMIPGRASF